MNDTIPMPPYSSSSNSDWTSSSTSGKSQPNIALHVTQSNEDELLQLAAQELETMKQQKPSIQGSRHFSNHEQSFPTACLRLMTSLPGNSTCVDCHSRTDITWASVSFGCLMCLQCSGKHRSLGVQTSFVKSVSMDGWKVHEILSMLEGGNDQLDKFFERHNMGKSGASCSDDNVPPTSPTSSGTLLDRYKTKAASFYRQHLINHAKELGGGGIYKGREASRSKKKKTPSPSSSRKHQRQQQQQKSSKSLPTVKEKCASMASSEASASNNYCNGNDKPLSSSTSPTQPREMKRQRSKGSGDIGFKSDNFQKMD